MSEFYGDLDSFGSVILDRIKNKYKEKKIGFTCSCFDILHCGHALMLKDAKEQFSHHLSSVSQSFFRNSKEKIPSECPSFQKGRIA